jgi:hypothetical protein
VGLRATTKLGPSRCGRGWTPPGTAVELMPIHQFVADQHLLERGLTS